MVITTGPARTLEDNPDGQTRTERDSIGELEVPADAYWGIHTARALANFGITRRPSRTIQTS